MRVPRLQNRLLLVVQAAKHATCSNRKLAAFSTPLDGQEVRSFYLRVKHRLRFDYILVLCLVQSDCQRVVPGTGVQMTETFVLSARWFRTLSIFPQTSVFGQSTTTSTHRA